MLQQNPDVIIIGAGPAGSTTAKFIAESGYSVLLIEKDETPGLTNVCAGGIDWRIVEEMKLHDIIERKISLSRFHFPSETVEIKSESATVHRNVFDKFLAHKAVEFGAELLTNHIVHDVEKKNGNLSVIIENRKTSEKYNINTRLVIFADGPNTLAAKQQDVLGFSNHADNVSVSAILEIESKNHSNFDIFFGDDISPWGYGWIFPKKNTINVGVCCLYSKLEKDIHAYLKYFLNRYLDIKEENEILRFTSALIPIVPAKKIFRDSMLVVGDAAGMVNPIFCNGISYAINGGRIAGKTAVHALKANDFSSEFLSIYQNEWKKTRDYHEIMKLYHLSNLFLYFSKKNKNTFSKMAHYCLKFL